jgi:hypothetical protein
LENQPSFIIIGTQKAGTTALHKYLSLHPQLIESKKEIFFFDCDKNYKKGVKFYLSHFQGNRNKKNGKFFEVSPSYLVKESAAKRIYDFNPEIKLVASLRNPIERAFSAWNMYRPRFHENDNWFFDWMDSCTLKKVIEKRKNRNFDDFNSFVKEEMEFILKNGKDSEYIIEAPILKHGFYNHQLSKFLQYFKKEQILLLNFNNYKQDIIGELKKIENFVGISSYKWEEIAIHPIFQGNYENYKISSETYNDLKEFFFQDKIELEKNFGIILF